MLALQGPDLTPRLTAPWTARLQYAYADALLAAGREDEALDWFRRADGADTAGETDAAARVAQFEGLEFVDLEDDVDLGDDVDEEATFGD